MRNHLDTASPRDKTDKVGKISDNIKLNQDNLLKRRQYEKHFRDLYYTMQKGGDDVLSIKTIAIFWLLSVRKKSSVLRARI